MIDITMNTHPTRPAPTPRQPFSADFSAVPKTLFAIPAKVGTQNVLDASLRGNDGNLSLCQQKPMPHSASRMHSHLARGFTLIELMVVLVIIGVLAALVVPNVLDRADDARVTAARTDVNNLMQALKLYKLDNQRFPTAAQGLQALLTKPTTSPVPSNWKSYLDKLPNDPWGRPYQYMNPGVKAEVDVLSFGADGQAGGEGKNADIGSWE